MTMWLIYQIVLLLAPHVFCSKHHLTGPGRGHSTGTGSLPVSLSKSDHDILSFIYYAKHISGRYMPS